MMTGFGFAAATFICTFFSALFGMAVRKKLPESHIGKDSQDVIRLGMGLVATMTALLLGLVTAAAKGSFDSQDVTVRNAAANVLTLDRLLARYGEEAAPIRVLLKQIIAERVEGTWPTRGGRAGLDIAQSQTRSPAEQIEDMIVALSPQSDAQRWFKAKALDMTQDVLKSRWRLLGSAGGSVPKVFMGVVIFWLSMTFASFGLSAPRNATVTAVFLVSALSVAGAVFLIFELDSPFDGIIRISAEPFRYTLSHLGQ